MGDRFELREAAGALREINVVASHEPDAVEAATRVADLSRVALDRIAGVLADDEGNPPPSPDDPGSTSDEG